MVFLTPGWRPRRSILFVPASNQRAIRKAAALNCDGLIFDLEDSVGSAEREAAYANLGGLSGADFKGRERVVRTTAVGSKTFEADLSAALAIEPEAILLPKIGSGDEIATAHERIGTRGTEIWAMIETPEAIVDIAQIAQRGSSLGLTAMVVGPNDLARLTGVSMRPGRAALTPWLMAVVAASRANGLAVLDGVYNDFRDMEGLAAECRQGAEFGFDGKTLIHPAQIDAANRAFSPGEQELAWARQVVAAFEAEDAAGRGVLQIDGEMVEQMHLQMALDLLAVADNLQLENRGDT